MLDYILYSLPLDIATSNDLEAIENKNYFKAHVRYVDGNTVRIQKVEHIEQNFISCSNHLKTGTVLELHQFKYLLRYYENNSWKKIHPKLKYIYLLPKTNAHSEN
jgi:hypothetical protein